MLSRFVYREFLLSLIDIVKPFLFLDLGDLVVNPSDNHRAHHLIVILKAQVLGYLDGWLLFLVRLRLLDSKCII